MIIRDVVLIRLCICMFITEIVIHIDQIWRWGVY
jgi:hypothetical protein